MSPIFKILVYLSLLVSKAAVVFAQQPGSDLTETLKETYGLNEEQVNRALSSVGTSGASLFSWPNLIGNLIFGTVGFVAFIYGKKQKNFKPLFIGVALMAYPYFFPNTFWVYGMGFALCALLYFWRD